MEWITWIVETLAEMELHLFQSMKKNLKRHQSEEEMRGYRWTQWQALQLQSINQAKNRYRSQINETFERLNPVAEQMITESFHEGAERFDEQYAEFKKYQSTGVKWEDLPVPEPPKQPMREVTETLTKPLNVTRGTDLFKPSEPLPGVAQEPKLRPKPTEIKVTVGATLKPAGDDTFFKVNYSKLDAVLLDVKRDMNVARYAAAKRMGVIHEDIVRKADIYMQTGTMTLAQAIDMASKEAAKAGLNCIEYKNGRRVNITSYVEMALRASSRRAALTAEGAKRDEWGEYLVVSPTLHSTCPSCAYWQGKVLIDDVYANGEPDYKHQVLSYAVKWAWDENSNKVPSHFLGPNCFVAGTEVLATGVMASSDREYIGEVVMISIAGGNKLTVTPNHPILTDKGWVSAGQLKKGDKVAKHIAIEEFTAFTGPDDVHVPTFIEDVTHSLGEALSWSPNVMVVAPEDFHGDGTDGKVAVISTNRLLGRVRNTKLIQSRGKWRFKPRMDFPRSLNPKRALFQVLTRSLRTADSIVSSFRKLSPIFRRQTRHTECIGCGKGFELADAGFSHPLMDGHLADTEMKSNSLLGHSRFKKALNFIHRKFDVIRPSSRINLRTEFIKENAFTPSSLFETGLTDADDVGNLLDSLSGKIEFRDITHVDRDPNFSGHVYNLQTKSGWYLADSIITHNCRHPLVTYFEGVTQIPKDSPYDQTRRNYNAEQKQRHLERMIREWKRKAAVAMTEKTMEEAEAKVKEWQNRLTLHILKHIHLREKKEREKIYLPRIAG